MIKCLNYSPQNSSIKAIDRGQCLCENQYLIIMKWSNTIDKQSIQTSAKRMKSERSFDLHTPLLVSGMDASENEFHEQTQLTSISSQQATFILNTNVLIGSRLNLTVDIPKTNTLGRQLKLLLTGVVIFIKGEKNNRKKQIISVRLDKKYKIRSLSITK